MGRPLFIKGLPFTIVGVAAQQFTGVESTATDVWIPFQVHSELNAWGSADKLFSADPNWWCILMIARMRPGVTKASGEAALNPLFQRAAYEPFGGKTAPGEKPTRLHLKEARGIAGTGDMRKPLAILQTMVGFLLLIACGNVLTLLAVRNAARGREFAVRLALGGSGERLFRQLLTESFVLLFCGALGGLIFAEIATRVLARWAELDVSLAPDLTVLLFTLGVSCLAGLVFGIAPAIGALRIPIAKALKTSAAVSYRDRSNIAAGYFTSVLQLALCLTLLAGTALLVRTVQKLENVNVGFHTGGLLVFGVSAPVHGEAQELAFYRGLTEKLRSLPQVESLTLMGNRIGSGWSNNTEPVVDGDFPRNGPGGVRGLLRWNNVGPDFARTLGMRLIAGRDFTDLDSAGAPPVAIVNQTFAQKFVQGRNAIGHTVSYTKGKPFTIVGVVGDSKYTGLTEGKSAMAWFPYAQVGASEPMHVEMRIAGPPMTLLPKVRETVAGFAPDLAPLQPRTQQAEFEETISSQRLLARLSTAFAILAAILVTAGLYGTTSYQVARRTSELGIRMALGAERGQVVWMILRGALAVAAVGLTIGLALAEASSRLLATVLYGIEPTDLVSLTAAAIGILAITMLATVFPARRAAAVDPIVALRDE